MANYKKTIRVMKKPVRENRYKVNTNVHKPIEEHVQGILAGRVKRCEEREGKKLTDRDKAGMREDIYFELIEEGYHTQNGTSPFKNPATPLDLRKGRKKEPRGLYEIAVPDLNNRLLEKRTRQDLIAIICNIGSVANEYTPVGVGHIGDRALAKLNLLRDGLEIRKKEHAKTGYTPSHDEYDGHIETFKEMLRTVPEPVKESLWKWLDENPDAVDEMIECVSPEELDSKGSHKKDSPADKREYLLSCTKQLREELQWRIDELETKIQGGR